MIEVNPEQTKPKIGILWSILRLYLVIAVPVLLVILNVRLVMTTQFLNFEYNRIGFPMDSYGFTTEDRMEYGKYGILYLLNDSEIEYLSDLRLPGELCYPPDEVECEMFNSSELSHMEDVKVVASGTFTAGLMFGIIFVLVSGLIWKYRGLDNLKNGYMQGSLLTLGLIATIVLLAITAWDLFFATFHSFFFEDGTWRFYFSDTLIRLYPEQFWFDASLVVGGLTTLGAFIILVVTLGLCGIRQLLP